jgi:hypothetical protein
MMDEPEITPGEGVTALRAMQLLDSQPHCESTEILGSTFRKNDRPFHDLGWCRDWAKGSDSEGCYWSYSNINDRELDRNEIAMACAFLVTLSGIDISEEGIIAALVADRLMQ